MLLLIKRIVFLSSTLIPALVRSYFFKDYRFLIHSINQAGALWIKIGQWLSIRNDLLPEELCDALTLLQSNINYHDPIYSLQVLNNSFNHKKLLKNFKKQPMNSGSIAQIHSAKLKNGTPVVIKIVHPEVREEMSLDMSIINYVVNFFPSNIKPILKQFIEQTDLRNEANSLTKFRDSFKEIKSIKFPKLIFVNQNIIVMTKLPGMIQSSFLKKYPQYQKEVHTLKVVAYYKMVCQDHYIHGDFHPGNILCHVNKNKEIQLGIVDPAPCIKIEKSKSALTDYFNQMISINPQKLCKLFIRCNTNSKANINMFKKKVLSLTNNSTGHNREKFCTDELKSKLFSAVRESGMILEGDLSFLLISFFLVHYQIENYKQIHLNALKYILTNNIFNIRMLVGKKFKYYINKNFPDKESIKNSFDPSSFVPNSFDPSSFDPSSFDPSSFKPSSFKPSSFKPSSFNQSSFNQSAFNKNERTAKVNSFTRVNLNKFNNNGFNFGEKNNEVLFTPEKITFAVKNVTNFYEKYKPALEHCYQQYASKDNKFKFYKTN